MLLVRNKDFSCKLVLNQEFYKQLAIQACTLNDFMSYLSKKRELLVGFIKYSIF